MKAPSRKMDWKEVKLAGNLITDDSVGMLDGLIGLEVLEGYDKTMVQKMKNRRPKRALEKPQVVKKSDKSSGNDSDQDDTGPAKKKKKKPAKKVVADDNDNSDDDDDDKEEEEHVGRFVIAPVDTSTQDFSQSLPEWQYYNLQNCLLEAIKDNGFLKPTEIQRLTLAPAIMGRRDILGAAETGSGKTLAFGLPILNGILHLKQQLLTNNTCSIRKGVKNVIASEDPEFADLELEEEEPSTEKVRPLFAIILTPTRELAVQVKDHIKAVAKYSGIKVAAIFGGMAHVKQKRVLQSCPEIVVATPGRLWELLKEGDPHLSKIDDVNFLVIDETDRMVEKGHFEELKLLMERLNRDQSKKSKRQNFIFSATLTLVHDIPDYLRIKNASRRKKFQSVSADEKLKQFIEGLGISQPKVVDITKKQGTAEKLTECRIVCEITEKDYYLYYFLQQHPGRTIVFCNSIDCVRRLGNLFSLLGCRPLPLHANMIQKQRLKNLEKFRDLPDALLIATDVAARGLDIPRVDHVIHYQVPRTSENYIHRSGRTARANTEGITVLLMEPTEMRYYNKICHTLNRTDDLPIFPVSSRHLAAVKDRVNLAREVDVLDLRATKESKEIGWLEKAAEEMDIMLDEFEAHNQMDDAEDGGRGSRKEDVAEKMKLVKLKKKELSKLLQAPIFPRGYSYKYPTATGQLSMPSMGLQGNKEGAVAVMQDAIEKDKVKELGKSKKESVLMGDHLKNHKGKRGGAKKNPRKPAVVKDAEETKGLRGIKNPALGGGLKKRNNKDQPAQVEEDAPKGKSGKKYYMPQPKTGKAKKGYKHHGKKAAKV